MILTGRTSSTLVAGTGTTIRKGFIMNHGAGNSSLGDLLTDSIKPCGRVPWWRGGVYPIARES